MKPFTCFLCAVALILICLSPWLLLSSYEEQPQAVPYKGILTLWHIADWRTGGSSGTAFLEARIQSFESDHAYLFIDVKTLTVSEAAEALSKGESPDIISYPYGADIPLSLVSLPSENTFFPGLPDTAYPYMCGGYCILVNTDMLDENGVEYPEGWGIRPDELLSAAQYGVCFDSESGYCAFPALALHEYPDVEDPSLSPWGAPEQPDAALGLPAAVSTDGLEAFSDDQACVLIASHRQLFEAGQRYEQGEAPAFFAFAIGGYTDMVQLISVPECSDTKKQAACTAFAQYMVSEAVQSKLPALGVLPAIPGLDVYADNACLSAMYTLLSDGAALPLSQDADRLASLSAQAFEGDESALKTLRRLLKSGY